MCGAGSPRPAPVSARLVLHRCRVCGHIVADHPGAEVDGDYHTQYDQSPGFLGSLEQTRTRQAAAMISKIRALVPGADAVLDFGCGRGWFLQECRRQGLARLLGADTSPRAVAMIRGMGMEGVTLVPRGEDWVLPPGALAFAPRILTLLDVIEHFPAARCGEIVRDILSTLAPGLELVVVKVPSSEGLLYRIAQALAKLGRPSALEQLYQVGTAPPHLSYFSPGSARRLLARCGLDVLAEDFDLEFEPASFGGRAHAVQVLPPPLRRATGYGLAAAARVTGAYDSVTFYARPR